MLVFRKTEPFSSKVLELALNDRALQVNKDNNGEYLEKTPISSKMEYFAPIWGKKAYFVWKLKIFVFRLFRKKFLGKKFLKLSYVLWKYITITEPCVYVVYVQNCI